MSFFEIHKTQAPLAISSLSAAGRANAGETPPQRGAQGAKSAAQDGVAVELAPLVDAGEPPVDTDRVSEIRAALKDGTYPILPARIADAMIAARIAMGLGE